MNSKAISIDTRVVLLLSAICMFFALSMSAQVQTNTTSASDTPAVQTQVESGEVAYVSGNDLVVKMSDGTIRHFANVPESARVNVDGQELGIHDLKPGMKLQRTITTTTTPKMITTVQSVTGKVWFVSPPNTVILTLADGKNQKFTIPKNQKFNVDGTMKDAWGLRKGMKISATKVVEVPVTEVAVNKSVTGEMPPPPPPPADVPILVVEEAAPAAAPEVAEAAPTELPKTGSSLPLIGLLGLLSLLTSLGLRTARKIS